MPFHKPGMAGMMPVKSNSIIYPHGDQAGHRDFLLDHAHEQHQAHVQGEIDQRRQGKGFEQVGGELGGLLGLREQFHQADQRGHGGVLEDVEEFRGKRRNDDPVGLGQQHVPVDLRQLEAHGTGGGFLAARQRLDTRAHLFTDPGGGKQPQAHDDAQVSGGGRVQVLLVPLLQIGGQQVRHQEVPDEQLDQQRHVTEKLHVAGGDARHQPVRHGAHHTQNRAQQQGNDPGDDGDGDGPAQAGHVPVEINLAADAGGLEEHAPVPVVIH